MTSQSVSERVLAFIETKLYNNIKEGKCHTFFELIITDYFKQLYVIGFKNLIQLGFYMYNYDFGIDTNHVSRLLLTLFNLQ